MLASSQARRRAVRHELAPRNACSNCGFRAALRPTSPGVPPGDLAPEDDRQDQDRGDEALPRQNPYIRFEQEKKLYRRRDGRVASFWLSGRRAGKLRNVNFRGRGRRAIATSGSNGGVGKTTLMRCWPVSCSPSGPRITWAETPRSATAAGPAGRVRHAVESMTWISSLARADRRPYPARRSAGWPSPAMKGKIGRVPPVAEKGRMLYGEADAAAAERQRWMDEPTNHMDMETIESLQIGLGEVPGHAAVRSRTTASSSRRSPTASSRCPVAPWSTSAAATTKPAPQGTGVGARRVAMAESAACLGLVIGTGFAHAAQSPVKCGARCCRSAPRPEAGAPGSPKSSGRRDADFGRYDFMAARPQAGRSGCGSGLGEPEARAGPSKGWHLDVSCTPWAPRSPRPRRRGSPAGPPSRPRGDLLFAACPQGRLRRAHCSACCLAAAASRASSTGSSRRSPRPRASRGDRAAVRGRCWRC